MNKSISILDAPSKLGLRPPEVGSVPGCYKMPWALRDRGLVALLKAEDAGSLVPPRRFSSFSLEPPQQVYRRWARSLIKLAKNIYF
jgi:hypothetical protein